MEKTPPPAKTASTFARASFTWPSTRFTITFESLPRLCASRSRVLMACGPSQASVESLPVCSVSFWLMGQNPVASTDTSMRVVLAGSFSSLTPFCSVGTSGCGAPPSSAASTRSTGTGA